VKDKWKKGEENKTIPSVAAKAVTQPPPTGKPMPSKLLSRRWLTSLKPPLLPFIAEHDVIW